MALCITILHYDGCMYHCRELRHKAQRVSFLSHSWDCNGHSPRNHFSKLLPASALNAVVSLILILFCYSHSVDSNDYCTHLTLHIVLCINQCHCAVCLYLGDQWLCAITKCQPAPDPTSITQQPWCDWIGHNSNVCSLFLLLCFLSHSLESNDQLPFETTSSDASTLNAIVCLTLTLFFWVTHSVDSNDCF